MRRTNTAIGILLVLGAVALGLMAGCATTPNPERNDRIIEAMDGLFDLYETMRIVQGKHTIAELIKDNPEKVAVWMTAAEALIQTIEAAGGDVDLLKRLQDEFKENFLLPMRVPVV